LNQDIGAKLVSHIFFSIPRSPTHGSFLPTATA
jgi:hypothetical protein